MSLHANVQGGTGGGKKKPFQGPAEDWFCGCPQTVPPYTGSQLNPGYLVRCPYCKEYRPT